MTTKRARAAARLLTAAGLLAIMQPALGAEARHGRSTHAAHRALAHHRSSTPPDAPDADEGATIADAGTIRQVGVASFYGPRHNGRRAADGSIFDQEAMTAAHRSLPFGSKVLVRDRATGREVVVTITDRLGTRRRVIDMSLGAARQLGILQRGIASVELVPL